MTDVAISLLLLLLWLAEWLLIRLWAAAVWRRLARVATRRLAWRWWRWTRVLLLSVASRRGRLVTAGWRLLLLRIARLQC